MVGAARVSESLLLKLDPDLSDLLVSRPLFLLTHRTHNSYSEISVSHSR